ncbi:hypothetical protein DFH06DRAFT_1302439 [Mycena polygramma]|nr:hypothetical protein DFH06DRAFT_1302439 [Mycena polygramma]
MQNFPLFTSALSMPQNNPTLAGFTIGVMFTLSCVVALDLVKHGVLLLVSVLVFFDFYAPALPSKTKSTASSEHDDSQDVFIPGGCELDLEAFSIKGFLFLILLVLVLPLVVVAVEWLPIAMGLLLLVSKRVLVLLSACILVCVKIGAWIRIRLQPEIFRQRHYSSRWSLKPGVLIIQWASRSSHAPHPMGQECSRLRLCRVSRLPIQHGGPRGEPWANTGVQDINARPPGRSRTGQGEMDEDVARIERCKIRSRRVRLCPRRTGLENTAKWEAVEGPEPIDYTAPPALDPKSFVWVSSLGNGAFGRMKAKDIRSQKDPQGSLLRWNDGKSRFRGARAPLDGEQFVHSVSSRPSGGPQTTHPGMSPVHRFLWSPSSNPTLVVAWAFARSIFSASELLPAVRALHQRGFIHRAIKPLTGTGHLQLTKFDAYFGEAVEDYRFADREEFIFSSRRQQPSPPHTGRTRRSGRPGIWRLREFLQLRSRFLSDGRDDIPMDGPHEVP